MDLVTGAIIRNKHICDNKVVLQQTWKKFFNQSVGKKIFLFGTGGGMSYFFNYCCNQYQNLDIEGVIDNNKEKQNQELWWHNSEAFQTRYEHILIQSPDVLREYHKQDVVVLITSVNYYDHIIDQLEQIGHTNYFVLLMMEVNERKIVLEDNKKDISEIREEYIDWCCQQKIVYNKIVMRIGEYGGHAKCITRKLLETGEDLDIVWLVYGPDVEAPEGVRLVPERNWKMYIYEMETARIWLFDAYMSEFIRKREGQIYIQTKHWSSITLKTFGLDDASTCVLQGAIDHLKWDGERMDYLFSGSKFDEDSCRSGLAFQGKAIRIGSARSDILFEPSVKEKVFTKFCLESDTHVLLYSPTYRDKEFQINHSMKISLDMESLLDILREKWEGNWVVFVRLHPWLNFEECGLIETDSIINAGNYPESEELVAASDVMITDYSSIMFEEAFLKRPVFLYAPDRSEYIDGERGLLLAYDELPFPIAESNESLQQCIVKFDQTTYEKKVTDFLAQYGVHEDGHASERAAKVIIDLMKGNLV